MTQAQQSEAQRLAAICETKGMFPVADELNRMHARIFELEQGKCLHQIAEPAAQRMDAKVFLSEADYDDLWRFEGMASDGEGYDISKERMKRLAELGVIRWCGGSRYGVTSFGLYVLKAWQRLPLETYEESNARCNAEFKARIERLNAEAIAAQAKQGGT